MIALPGAAFANFDLACNNGFPVEGTFIFPGVGNVDSGQPCPFGFTQPFSLLNCFFQGILNEVIARMYCGIQFQLAPLLLSLITLFITIYGIMFTMGLAALTARELVTRLIKIALIWTFATNAAWGIGLAFFFIIGGIGEIITWILAVLFPLNPGAISATGNGAIFDFVAQIDFLIFNQVTGGLTTQGFALLGFFATLIALMFPVFLLFLVYMMTVMAILVRTIITYLIGITAISFLLAIGPIFVSLALFQSTYTFFDSWLRYIVSFAMQIILVFAAVALWLYVITFAGSFFVDLAAMIVPYEDVVESQTGFGVFRNTWGICYNVPIDPGDSGDPWRCDPGTGSPYCQATGDLYCTLQAKDLKTDQLLPYADAAPPKAYSANNVFISWIVRNLISLGILMYAFDALLRIMPNLARQLAGPIFAPQIAGGPGFGTVRAPGFSQLSLLKRRARTAAFSGGFGKLNSIRSSIGGGLGFSGSQRAQNYQDQVSKALGNRNNNP